MRRCKTVPEYFMRSLTEEYGTICGIPIIRQNVESLRILFCGVLLKNTAQYAELFDVIHVVMWNVELLRILKVV